MADSRDDTTADQPRMFSGAKPDNFYKADEYLACVRTASHTRGHHANTLNARFGAAGIRLPT